VNLGVNYQGFDSWVPTLQLNVINKTADSGTAADTWATGGTLAYLTPGLLYRLTDKSQVYVNVQLPVYQNVNGIQLVPSYIASMGVRVHF
jgi:outer membrane receptor for monomeric catechols